MARNLEERKEYERRNLIASLMKIEHGKLDGYLEMGLQAARAEPELLAHLISWNRIKGKVRDSKIAYPIISLRVLGKNEATLAENSIAHLLTLSPRDLVRAYNFSRELTRSGKPIKNGFRDLLEVALHGYLEVRQQKPKWWDKTVLQHRDSMKRLYRLSHHKPTKRAQEILFEGKYPSGSVFEKVAMLGKVTAKEAAALILGNDIPFQVVVGATSNIKNKDVILALLEGATGNQIVTNSKMFEKLGVKNDPVLMAAYNAALLRAKEDKKLNVLKAGIAAERSEYFADGLLNLQAHATKQLGSIEGNWLILADASGSMSTSIELARKIASLITERVSGKVWLIYFNTAPTPFDVTGKNYFQINNLTKHVKSGEGTSIGCGLSYLDSMNEEVDGIAIVSDGGDNSPPYFVHAYRKYSDKYGKEPTVYHFNVDGDMNAISDPKFPTIMSMDGIEVFDVRGGKVDYNSLPNIVETLRVNKYSLLTEILNVPLLTIEEVLNA
jgi:hypothetical protein